MKPFLQYSPAFALLPPVEVLIESLSADCAHTAIQQSCPAQMQHNLRYCAGQKNLNCGEVVRPVWKSIHEPWDCTIDRGPICCRRSPQSRCVSDGGNMQQQISRSSEGGMHHHRIANRSVCEHVACSDAKARHSQDRARGTQCR